MRSPRQADVERVTTQAHAQAIRAGLDLLPERIRQRLAHVAFFTADPIAAGLHSYIDSGDGRSFREIAHHIDAWAVRRPRSERRSTVVLQDVVNRDLREGAIVVVHELAHALDEELGHSYTPKPTTDYSYTNRFEAFAEAFTAWAVETPRNPARWIEGQEAYDTYNDGEAWEAHYAEGRELLFAHDPETVAFFERLARD